MESGQASFNGIENCLQVFLNEFAALKNVHATKSAALQALERTNATRDEECARLRADCSSASTRMEEIEARSTKMTTALVECKQAMETLRGHVQDKDDVIRTKDDVIASRNAALAASGQEHKHTHELLAAERDRTAIISQEYQKLLRKAEEDRKKFEEKDREQEGERDRMDAAQKQILGLQRKYEQHLESQQQAMQSWKKSKNNLLSQVEKKENTIQNLEAEIKALKHPKTEPKCEEMQNKPKTEPNSEEIKKKDEEIASQSRTIFRMKEEIKKSQDEAEKAQEQFESGSKEMIKVQASLNQKQAEFQATVREANRELLGAITKLRRTEEELKGATKRATSAEAKAADLNEKLRKALIAADDAKVNFQAAGLELAVAKAQREEDKQKHAADKSEFMMQLCKRDEHIRSLKSAQHDMMANHDRTVADLRARISRRDGTIKKISDEEKRLQKEIARHKEDNSQLESRLTEYYKKVKKADRASMKVKETSETATQYEDPEGGETPSALVDAIPDIGTTTAAVIPTSPRIPVSAMSPFTRSTVDVDSRNAVIFPVIGAGVRASLENINWLRDIYVQFCQSPAFHIVNGSNKLEILASAMNRLHAVSAPCQMTEMPQQLQCGQCLRIYQYRDTVDFVAHAIACAHVNSDKYASTSVLAWDVEALGHLLCSGMDKLRGGPGALYFDVSTSRRQAFLNKIPPFSPPNAPILSMGDVRKRSADRSPPLYSSKLPRTDIGNK